MEPALATDIEGASPKGVARIKKGVKGGYHPL